MNPEHRLTAMRPCSAGYRAVCECGWESGPFNRREAREAFHDHTYTWVPLRVLVAAVQAGWDLLSARWWRQGDYYAACAEYMAELENVEEAA